MKSIRPAVNPPSVSISRHVNHRGIPHHPEDNLLLADEDLGVLAGEGTANPANRFHSWVYRARPEVNCITPTHPPQVSAPSVPETPPVVSHVTPPRRERQKDFRRARLVVDHHQDLRGPPVRAAAARR
ncbi:class II aldolase/adducin family protein [Kitasatospora sp. NPDC004272]